MAPFHAGNSSAVDAASRQPAPAAAGVNRQVLFRRALKIINGGMVGGVNNLPAAGFTVAAENPVYVQGNFNATTTSVAAEPNVATSTHRRRGHAAVERTSSTRSTFRLPNDTTSRNATETGYRFAMITGKSVPFAKPGGWGVHGVGIGRRRPQLHAHARGLERPERCATAARW